MPAPNAFAELVGCELPLQGAPMGGVATGPDLAVAVAEAGGHGMVAAIMLPAAALVEILEEVARRTERPVGVNFLMPFLNREAVEAAAERVSYVDFFYADPDPSLIDLVHAGGALAGWQVGSVAEAGAAADAGCDVVVAQGVEAGGHVRGSERRMPLLEAVLDAVDVPVLSAGGIAAADDVDGALRAGAAGVRVGTRLIATPEANAHPRYLEALLAADPEDTVLTEAFSVGWPDAPHRVLASCVEAASALDDEIVAEFELAGAMLPVPRFNAPSPTRDATGKIEAMAHYAGESVGAVRQISPAAEIVRELCAGITAIEAERPRTPPH